MNTEKILDSHEILYESRNVLLVNNRCEDALADYWDNDVVVWDPDIQAVIGAGGDTVPTGLNGGPCKIENLGTIDLRKATRKDFPYIESECLVYRAVALALNKSGQVPELLVQIEDEVLRIDIAQEISSLEVEDE